jgi:hypothetical protein
MSNALRQPRPAKGARPPVPLMCRKGPEAVIRANLSD